ncbi:MAG: hypothetical protein IKS68_01150, partial [Mailhella sp.]|nr:hypothetical protein [Mailhella sp.]
MRNKLCFAMSVAALLCMAQPLSSQAALYEVSATGKSQAAAEGNSRMNALRQCLNGMITPEDAKKHAMELRPIFRKVNSLTSLEVLESGKQKKLVAIRANVTVDEDALRAELKAIPALADLVREPEPVRPAPDIRQPEQGGEKPEPATPPEPNQGNDSPSQPQANQGGDTPSASGSGGSGGADKPETPEIQQPVQGSDTPDPSNQQSSPQATEDPNLHQGSEISLQQGDGGEIAQNAGGGTPEPAVAAGPLTDADFLALVSSRDADPGAVIDALRAGSNANASMQIKGENEAWPALMVYLDTLRGPRLSAKSADAVSAFIEAGADVNWAGAGFERSIVENALRLVGASEEGEKIFRTVLAAKPDLNRMDARYGRPLLHALLGMKNVSP